MGDTVEPLILDLLAWLEQGERSYIETMDAWRTSCPRLPVWESANDQGLVTRAFENGCATVRVTPKGRELLRQRT